MSVSFCQQFLSCRLPEKTTSNALMLANFGSNATFLA